MADKHNIHTAERLSSLVYVCVCVPVGQCEAVLPYSDQLPGSQQSDCGGLHVVHTGQPHSE